MKKKGPIKQREHHQSPKHDNLSPDLEFRNGNLKHIDAFQAGNQIGKVRKNGGQPAEGKILTQKEPLDFIQMDSPEAVLMEAKVILRLISPDCDTDLVANAFNSTISLYQGGWKGYQACNTDYHDLAHTIDTFLAMARIIHGAVVAGEVFTDRQIALGLVTALLHDAGYIQIEDDREGSGSKYTVSHVQRSMDFLEYNGVDLGLSDEEIIAGRAMTLCTDLSADIPSIVFPSLSYEILGKMLGTTDLLAQMADRIYLEKLLFLYYEFKEADVGGYENEVDLLRKTMGFYGLVEQRLETVLSSVDRFMIPHFTSRWGIKDNLYQRAIEKNKRYLKKILKDPNCDPRDFLKRRDIINIVGKKYRRNDTQKQRI